jgi:ribonuclease BN (tRNA processing enzyme)
VQLTILGSSAAYPGPGGACSGYLVQEGKTNLLVDCGTGVLSNLQKAVKLQQVNNIVISHFHADHFFDLIPYRYALTRQIYRDIHPVLYLPPGGRKVLLKAVSSFDKSMAFFSDRFQIEEYDPKVGVRVGNLDVEFAAVKHYISAYAMSISGKKKLVYSADSGLCEELADIAQGADMFLCEATRYGDADGEWGHMLAGDAAKLAKDAKVKKLILTHFWPDHDYSKELDQARKIFGKGLEGVGVLRTYVI